MKDRRKCVQLRAVLSARLSRTVGVYRLARASAFYERRRRREGVRKRSKPRVCSSFAPRRLECIRQSLNVVFDLAAQVSATQGQFPVSSAALSVVEPYFDAVDKHIEVLRETDVMLEKLTVRVATAKAPYHGAFRSLETLSEQTHARNFEIRSCEDSSAIPAEMSARKSLISSVDCTSGTETPSMSPAQPIAIPMPGRSLPVALPGDVGIAAVGTATSSCVALRRNSAPDSNVHSKSGVGRRRHLPYRGARFSGPRRAMRVTMDLASQSTGTGDPLFRVAGCWSPRGTRVYSHEPSGISFVIHRCTVVSERFLPAVMILMACSRLNPDRDRRQVFPGASKPTTSRG